ncbi:hypothetical protein TSAR_015276 [Trichomalopsis sarcophagae]|uniref:Uncharacterized protein n=1 Tax=Trichomalopsis sarcophagae TaxID=543379 RepID=A0A232FC86_9HYME|nr:hypothetical protein TSAR_015276 [Trichomalopsis sarcophagae]
MLANVELEVNTADSDDYTVMYQAVCSGNIELVNTLIDDGLDINIQDENGTAALHIAIDRCYEDMALQLMLRGAHVDVQTEAGNTPLHMAARLNKNHSHEFLIRNLLNFGSNINCLNNKNLTPFSFMLETCSIETLNHYADRVQMDLQNLSTYNFLHCVAQNEDMNVMHLVLDKGLPINQQDSDLGMTPLHLASYYLNVEYVRQLIARGADIKIKNSLGLTPVFMSLIMLMKYQRNTLDYSNLVQKCKKVIKQILKAGCDVATKITHQGETSLLNVTIDNKLHELTELIIRYVVKLEAKTNEPLFDDYHLSTIKSNQDVRIYYSRCKAELEAMKARKVNGTLVKYFSILMEPLQVVICYARNQELVREFQASDYKTAFPIYGKKLTKKIEEAIRKQNDIQTVSAILSNMPKFADLGSDIIDMIGSYLSQDDVNYLTSSAAIEESKLETM